MAPPNPPELPRPWTWQPRPLAGRTLEQTFLERCRGIEELLVARAEIERRFNLDNFDSGPGVEDIVREEFARLLPKRYAVRAGVLSNSDNLSAGDCDVIVFNDFWFPSIKAGATEQSRRWHYPIEGAYGTVEIKQTLTRKSLDEAMEKLITASRLQREPHIERDVENRAPHLPAGTSQPLFTAVLATRLGSRSNLDDLVKRFIAINGMVGRREVVNALCVLGSGFVAWGHFPAGETKPRVCSFTPDEDELELFPLLVEGEGKCSFYELATYMLGYFHGQVLAGEDIPIMYGGPQTGLWPEDESWNLVPDSRIHERMGDP